MRTLTRWTAAAAATLILTGAACSSDDSAEEPSDETAETSDNSSGALDETLATDVIAHYADGVFATYSRSVAAAETMSAAIDAFVATPTDATLTAAREAWVAARDDYGHTEAFRFGNGPIDNEESGPEGMINGWPMDEAYVDYVEGDPTAGIIANTADFPDIDAAVLAEANEDGGETNLSTGWHAIEFLLWGQDLSTDGPGNRPVTDYTTDANAQRRATYLTEVTGLLLDQLTEVRDAWTPDADNYRAELAEMDPREALVRIITGIGELSRGELGGERMNVAYEARSQEDEHSCFSDNTTADLLANADGIKAVWTGDYIGLDGAAVSGPGIEELVAGTDAELATETTAAIEQSVTAITAIPAPFDQHLVADAPDDGPGRTQIRTAIDALGAQADLIIESADAVGVAIEVS